MIGGEANQVTSFSCDVEHYKLFKGARNQQWLAVVLNVYPCMTPQETAAKDSEESTSGRSGQVFDRLMVILTSSTVIIPEITNIIRVQNKTSLPLSFVSF